MKPLCCHLNFPHAPFPLHFVTKNYIGLFMQFRISHNFLPAFTQFWIHNMLEEKLHKDTKRVHIIVVPVTWDMCTHRHVSCTGQPVYWLTSSTCAAALATSDLSKSRSLKSCSMCSSFSFKAFCGQTDSCKVQHLMLSKNMCIVPKMI